MSTDDNGQGPGSGKLSPHDRAQFERRVSELGDKLGKVRAEQAAEDAANRGSATRGRGMSYGIRMASELVAAVIVGGLMGYGLDLLLGSKPWLFLLFFVLGFAAGVLNVMRGYTRLQADISRETGGKIGHSVPDDED
ncbi:MAG: AtpZ/AtpI family protein [Hyphomicrobiaceae bacterium]|nr:AtpZ/AtpI family protein [Hyphomicrobiaceae bacterium]